MLSVGSRDGGGKGLGLGFGGGGGMEENELEEGEAFSGNDDDSCIDPDIALSYIDEKLQDVLGHFQKDFEGGVSAENLGAKYGGYGSFLPSYQRSPSVWLQPKSPIPNHNASRSPHNSSSEGARQNPPVSMGTSVSKNNNAPTSHSVDNSGKTSAAKFSAGEPVPRHDFFNKPANGGDQKTLKVRIKVGPDNSFATNNAAIYSGLGLDTPSPSTEDSPDGNGGELSPDLRLAPDESPTSILRIMTCFPVPGGYLLSPLPDSVMHLTKRESAFLKNGKTNVLPKNIRETCTGVADMVLPAKDAKGFIEKKIKPDEKSSRIIDAYNSDSKDEISSSLKRDMDNETPEGQILISEALNISILSGSRSADVKTERQVLGDLVKVASRVSDLSNEPNRIPPKDKISSPDLQPDHLLESTPESIKNNGTCWGNETTYSRGKPNNKMILEEKQLEEQKASNLNDTAGEIWRESTFKGEKNYDTTKYDSVGYKVRENHTAIAQEPPNSISAQKIASYEPGEGIFRRKDQLVEGKINIKESSTTIPHATKLTKENQPAVSHVKSKEKKKSSHARGDHSENKTKGLKSQKEVSKGRSKDSRRVVVGDANAEQMQYRTDLMETNYKNRPNDLNLEQEKRSFTFTEKSNDRPGVKRVENPPAYQAAVDAPVKTPLVSNAPNSYAAGAPQAPVFIKENWVACDVCQEWRLLPYGTDPSHLPKKWQCSMQSWLPELNKCHISEAVTTKAINALYQNPVPESGANLNSGHEVATSTITPNDVSHFDQRLGHNMQSVPTVVKKKQVSKDESNVPTSAKSRSMSDVNEYPSETNLSNKIRHTSKSSDFALEKHKHKQKEKHKILGRHSDGGDIIENNGKHSKSKSKRVADQDGLRTLKKSKKEGAIENRYTNLDDVAGRDPLSTDNGFPSKSIGYSQKDGDYSSSKELRCDPKGHLPASIKKMKDAINVFSSGDLKDNFSASDVEISDTVAISAKKRKVKEWQASQSIQENQVSSQQIPDDNVIMKEDFSNSQRRKQKKAKLAKSDGKESGTSKGEGKMEKGRSTRILLSGSKHPPDGMDEIRCVAGKEQLGKDQGKAASRQSLDCSYYSKKDLAYTQTPAGATSSSSKISGSRKSKRNIHEARGSPVESVSSSPLRISNIEKLSSRRKSAAKDGVVNGGFSITGSPKRCSDFEIDGASDRSGIRRKETSASIQQRSLESQRAAKSGVPGVLDSLRGPHDFSDAEANQLSGGIAGDRMHLECSRNGDHSPLLFEDKNVASGTGYISHPHHSSKYICDATDDHIHDQHEMHDPHNANKNSQRKSGKNSSLHFKDNDRSSKSDVEKGQHKVYEFSREEKEAHSTKNGSCCRSEADIVSHGRSTYHDELRSDNFDAQENDERDQLGKNDTTVKLSTSGKKDANSSNKILENMAGSSMFSKLHKDFDSTIAGASCSKSNLHENLQQVRPQRDDKSSNFLSDRGGHLEIISGRGKSQSIPSSKDKHEVQTQGPQSILTLTKGSRSEGCPIDAVNSDAPKVVKQSKRPESHNGPRHATPSGPDTSSPIRKDGHPTANIVLREARDLKHTANRLKSEGLELESTGLYFEAALKFLHVASLWEPTNLENAKHGDAIQSMQMYSDTARLCEFCAHEYEKWKEMAAAALAYKCVEVAYMKVAYFKHPSASKDRHELQAALQMVPPGESPSSSASDVDNLNNLGTLDKAASAKGTASPQIAGSHVIAARNRPNFMRLLNYMNDLNCAFEATRKSQNAIAAAIANLGKDGVDGMSSVKRALDFNFHNVEGLLRLVRLSMESISH